MQREHRVDTDWPGVLALTLPSSAPQPVSPSVQWVGEGVPNVFPVAVWTPPLDHELEEPHLVGVSCSSLL